MKERTPGSIHGRTVVVLCAARTGSSMTLSLLHRRLGYPMLGEYRPDRHYDFGGRFLLKVISDASDYGRMPYLLSDPTVAKLIGDPDVALVCVERRNLISQLLSLAIARKTQVWHTTNLRDGAVGHAGYLARLRRSVYHLPLSELDDMLEDIRIYEQLVARLRRPAATVYYEDFEHDHGRLFDLLGLEREPSVVIPTKRVVPDALKHRVVRNVDAIVARVREWMDDGRLTPRDPFGGPEAASA